MIADNPTAFAALLSRFRPAARLTQEELAERAGLSVRGIGALERGGRTRPRAYTVRRLAEAPQRAPADRCLVTRTAGSDWWNRPRLRCRAPAYVRLAQMGREGWRWGD